MEPDRAVAGGTGVTTATASPPATVAELYEATYARLVGLLTLACASRADAEEVVQDAFVQALRHWPRVRELTDPEAWVRKVAFRLLSNRLRKARNGVRARLLQSRDEDAAAPSAERIDVQRALAALPAGQRHVVVLHHLVGLEVTEVAAELGVAVGTVKSRLHRGRAALAPLLREEWSRA